MTNRLIHKKSRQGFTLLELLTVIGMIAILCAIAIPSYISISRSLSFSQKNDYAQSIFMACQANLTKLRSQGRLAPLQIPDPGSIGAGKVEKETSGFPEDSWSEEYMYTVTGTDAYTMVLPGGAVDEAIRSQSVLIEYNPITGNVFSVFYSEKFTPDELKEAYLTLPGLPRNERGGKALRKKKMLGYYCGSGLSSSRLRPDESRASMEFTNGEEGIITVKIPMPESYFGSYADFASGLNIDLTILGSSGNVIEKNVKKAGSLTPGCSLHADGRTVLVKYTLDSLADGKSFGNISVKNPGISVTSIQNEADFPIKPGENVTVTAAVQYLGSGNPVLISPGMLIGINPMFGYLNPSPSVPGKYILSVANGRNLQNLNLLAPSIADKIEKVVFTDDIDWNNTVCYYNDMYGSHAAYRNAEKEAPGRSLPYFVPIHNEMLFGTAQFVFPGEGEGTWQEILGSRLQDFIHDDFQLLPRVPYLLDDNLYAGSGTKPVRKIFAAVDGRNHSVSNLNIDALKYKIPNLGTKNEGKYYVAGVYQTVDYNFTGLFGYLNTTVDSLHLVNPIIKGCPFDDRTKELSYPVLVFSWQQGLHWEYQYIPVHIHGNPATGSLAGAAGYNTLITNCSVYLDTHAEDFSWNRMEQAPFSTQDPQTWYGVSGQGAVGGLVGYAKSHRTFSGTLDGNLAHLAFSNSFAAVPVSGEMRSTDDKYYGYSNGIGGMVGNSQLTNFYNCYASGNVMAGGGYLTGSDTHDDFMTLLGLKSNAQTGTGAGGFVGTSHGTRYTNCFSSGNVTRLGGSGAAGGFVGMMCYDENYSYGLDPGKADADISQHTVFESCYCVGTCCDKSGFQKTYLENFSGANGKVLTTYSTLKAYSTSDFYKLMAPHYLSTDTLPDYSEFYIFKDCFYLSQYKKQSGVSQDASNRCAYPIAYDELQGFSIRNAQESQRQHRLKDLQGAALDANAVHPIVRSLLDNLFGSWKNFGSIIRYLWDEQNYNVYFKIDDLERPDHSPAPGLLRDYYMDAYAKGFPTDVWHDSDPDHTHYYGSNFSDLVYPFPCIQGLAYYGSWPEKTLTAGLAYYEFYTDEHGQESVGYYFDREETSSLKSYHGIEIISDGYAVFSANENDIISVYINGQPVVSNLRDKDSIVTLSSPFGPDSNRYYVTRLPKDALDCFSGTDFYSEVRIDINSESFYCWFNPNTANSHTKTTEQPTEVPPDPKQIIVRTARQLSALSRDPSLWLPGRNLLQQRDIDASVYRANSYRDSDAAAILSQIRSPGSIGTAKEPFQGTYTGAASQKETLIRNIFPPEGLFGTIGENGTVQSLKIQVSVTDTLEFGSSQQDCAGIVASKNYGTLKNIDLILSAPENQIGTVSLRAAAYAGSMAGCSDGILENCTVAADSSVTVAFHARCSGGFVGGLGFENPEKANLVRSCSLSASHNLIFIGDCAGGFAGIVRDTAAENILIEADNITSSAEKTGGFAGLLQSQNSENPLISAVRVKVTGSFSSPTEEEACLAGFAAGVSSGTHSLAVTNCRVELPGELSGANVFGMFGKSRNLDCSSCDVNLTGSIHASGAAAGFGWEIGGSSELSRIYIYLSDLRDPQKHGTVSSDRCAAGFVCSLRDSSTVSQCSVLLGQDSSAAPEISGQEQAAGFLCTAHGSQIIRCSVSGAGSICSGGKASGFAHVLSGNGKTALCFATPVFGGSHDGYAGNSNDCLTVTGGEAAGFAGMISSGTVSRCYTLCKIQGFAGNAGFTLLNQGEIQDSFSNVTITGGYGFAGENREVIENCYGWYGNGAFHDEVPTVSAPLGQGTCRSCYFADLDSSDVLLFDFTGTPRIIFPEELSGSLDALADPEDVHWSAPGSFPAYPYSPKNVSMYPYPMLGTHCGQWALIPQYAYGVCYYEIYDDGSIKLSFKDLSDPESTIEDHDLSTGTSVSFDESGTIAQAGYGIICHRGVSCPDPLADVEVLENGEKISSCLGDAVAEIPADLLKSNVDYSLYRLDAQGLVTLKNTQTGRQATVWTYFADEFAENAQEHQIRTAQQLDQLCKAPGDCFIQTHDIPAFSASPVESFTGTYDGQNFTIGLQSDSPWIQNLGGSLKNMNLTLSGSLRHAPVKECRNGSAENITLITDSLEAPMFEKAITSGFRNIRLSADSAALTTVAEQKSGDIVTVNRICGGLLIAEADSCTIAGCSISVPQITVSGDGIFGTLVGILSDSEPGDSIHPVIENCILNPADPLHPENARQMVLSSDGGIIGGLTGQNDGILKNNTVNSLLIRAEPQKEIDLIAGGLTGTGTGSISHGNYQISITYKEPLNSTGSVIIGGLVGRMDGGMISHISNHTGQIKPEFASSGGKFCIAGGIVGEETANKEIKCCQNVTTSVKVDPAWAPAGSTGRIPVGMFAGRISDGSFTDCASVAPNQTFQFLGDIRSYDVPADGQIFSRSQHDLETVVCTGNSPDDAALTEGFSPPNSHFCYSSRIQLHNCTYLCGSSAARKTYRQTVTPEEFYYRQEPVRPASDPEPVKVNTLEKVTPGYQDISDAPAENKVTAYYGADRDGNYRRLYVTRKDTFVLLGWNYSYSLQYKDENGNFVSYDSSVIWSLDYDNAVLWDGSKPLYRIPGDLPAAGDSYLIFNKDGKILEHSGEQLSVRDYHGWIFTDDAAVMWQFVRQNPDIPAAVWVNGSAYLGADMSSLSPSPVSIPYSLREKIVPGDDCQFFFGSLTDPFTLCRIPDTSYYTAVYHDTHLCNQIIGSIALSH